MKNIKVAAVVLNQTPLDWVGNKNRIIESLNEARSQGVQVVCYPELGISGYGCEDAFLSPFVAENSLKMLLEILPYTQGQVVSMGLPLYFRGSFFNVNAVIVNQKIIGIIPKKFLAGDGVHYENRWFRAWDNNALEFFEIDAQDLKMAGLDLSALSLNTPLNTHGKKSLKVPLGDYFFDIGGVKIGLEICEEAWVAQRVGAGLSRKGVDLILNPSASHFAFGKHEVRKRFVIEGSRAFGVAYIYTNLLGNESGRVIFDGGALISSNGDLVMQSPRFSFRDWEVYSCVIDIDENRIRRTQTASFKPELGEDESAQLSADFDWKFLVPEGRKLNVPTWENSKFLKHEEFYRATTLGLFDYLRKSHSRGFVVSLSGGVDSSVVAILATRTFQEARANLSKKEFLSKLNYLSSLEKSTLEKSIDADNAKWWQDLVFTAYQQTENSSKETMLAAEELSKELGTTFYQWKVDKLVQEYQSLIEKSLDKKLSWKEDDIALQNIQARVRSPSIWMVANIKKAILLSTSNRSEAAVGYATMDGDTSGGLSPIAGVEKSFLKIWLKWMGDMGPEGVGSVASVKYVFAQQPTAELRPKEQTQFDEVDLMPYEILDKIGKEFIRNRRSPLEIVEKVKLECPHLEKKVIAGYVKKFLTLWSRNQWKRERYAPSFHLDDESLDPKTWCRYPILMSSFETEIESLEKYFTH